MNDILHFQKKYQGKLDPLDLDLIISRVINKSREFVLTHSEYRLGKYQALRIRNYSSRRIKGEPLAYILGHKEFFRLDFKVDKNVLIPRSETELLVEKALKLLRTKKYPPAGEAVQQKTNIIDVGTGSGNIIISMADSLKNSSRKLSYLAIDRSKKALAIAEHNAKRHKLNKKIEFIHGHTLKSILSNKQYVIQNTKYIILANLPYVSFRNYKKYHNQLKYEPRSALLSKRNGLDHYNNLLKQIKTLDTNFKIQITVLIEFSPEQKIELERIIKDFFPAAKTGFVKDLAGKWRVCKIRL